MRSDIEMRQKAVCESTAYHESRAAEKYSIILLLLIMFNNHIMR